MNDSVPSDTGEVSITSRLQRLSEPPRAHTAAEASARRLQTESRLQEKVAAGRAMRSAAMRDAVIVVSRAMRRRGQEPTAWTDQDTQAAEEIAVILAGLHEQGVSTPDAALS